MLGFFVGGIFLTLSLCIGSYLMLQRRVLTEEMSLDDAKGYLLICCVLSGFLVSASCFYIGQTFLMLEQGTQSGQLALALLLDVTSALAVLIFGLQRMRLPEQY